MSRDVVILIAEDNEGHFLLTKNYLQRMGVRNDIVWLPDGQATLDFLSEHASGKDRDYSKEYVLILDIRMPKIDGEQVLMQMQENEELRDVPVIMLTCTGNPSEIEKYHDMGCRAYIVKPVKYSSYLDAMKKVGMFPSTIPGGVMLVRKESVHAP